MLRTRIRPRQTRAQETGCGRRKRRARGGIGFDSSDNEVAVVTVDGEHQVPMSRQARRSLDAILDAVLNRPSSNDTKVPLNGTLGGGLPLRASRKRRSSRGIGLPPHHREHRHAVEVREEVWSTSSRAASTSSSRTTRASVRPLWRARCRVPSTASSRACSAPPTCCPRTSSAPRSTTSASRASSSGPARSSPTWCSSTRSTGPRRRPSRPAGVHAGAPGHGRGHLARARAAVPRVRHAEPGRVRGHLYAARGAGRPLHGPALARLPRPPRKRPGC